MDLKRLRKNKAEIQTGALNDILFILLLFFLIVSTLANPNVIKVNNPTAKAEDKAKQSVVVSITASQEIFVGQEKVDFSSLETTLKQTLEKESSKPTIVINGDSNSYLGNSIKVMQIAKKLGATAVMAIKSN
ncbi:MAG: biopolymer transporter ExbD [Sediminibacterium sp.]|nr:biopolymer transporter ExbD [Sediminibacterium sp.]